MKKIISILVLLCTALLTVHAERVIVGAEQTKQYLPLLKNKRVALLSNHTGIIIQTKSEARLDGKGRVFIPASYRKILAEMGSTHIVMRRDTDNECIIFYPEHVWHQKVSQLRNALDEWDPEDQMILMQFMSEAEMLDMDSQGRILLQKKNLEMINAEKAPLPHRACCRTVRHAG